MNQHHRIADDATPLAGTTLDVIITDLLAEYEVRHRFRNDSKRAIEAIYSFPVPLDAAFLGMRATLGEETLVARVMPAGKATRRYDDAIADGDSAVLVEQVEPGMLCVCLGSLHPGEHGEIVLRFAAVLGVAGRIARFSLPFVHRPRYGRSRLLDNGAYPTHDFATEHPLKANIRIRGLLANRPVQCTTHGARFLRDGDETVLNLDRAMLDRDLVLAFDLGDASISSLRRIRDGDRSIGVLTFVVPRDAQPPATPLDICLLLDGSGSMQGDAIMQSRAALHALAGKLRDDDRIQVLRFGDDVVPLFRRSLRASTRVRTALIELEGTINAELGGTEIALALRRAIDTVQALDGPPQCKVVILVTDGAVHAHTLESVMRDAVQAGVRIFVVAVGSSAGVDVLAPLAAATGATLERAVPAEPIDAAVLRQLHRAREPGPLDLAIDWGVWATPLPSGVVYPSEAATALAFLADNAPRTIRLRQADSAQTFTLGADAAETSEAWRAWAGQQAYRHAPAPARETLALQYGLITPETSAVLVKVRAEDRKSDGLPKVLPVAHMTPAGMVAPHSSIEDSMRSGRTYACALGGADLFDMPATSADGLDDSLLATTESPGTSGHVDDMEPPLSEERLLLVGKALLQALFKLLFVEELHEIDTDSVLAEVEADLRNDATRFLAESGFTVSCVAEAFDLFNDLGMFSDTIPDFTDDQEAVLSILRHP